MIEEPLLLVLLALFIYFLWIDFDVTRQIVAAAQVRPYVETLRATALSSILATTGAICTVLVGLNSLWFLYTDTRLLPTPIPTGLLLIALAAPSIGKLYLKRLINRWKEGSL